MSATAASYTEPALGDPGATVSVQHKPDESYTMAIVRPEERSATAGITGVARTIGAAAAPVFAGLLFAGACAWPARKYSFFGQPLTDVRCARKAWQILWTEGVHHVIARSTCSRRAAPGETRSVEASRGRVHEPQRKRSRFSLVSKPGLASPSNRMKSDMDGEATGKHPSGSSGWLEVARGQRSVEEPGKPSWEAKSQREVGRNNHGRPRGWRRGP